MGQEAEDLEFGKPEERGDFVDDKKEDETDELQKGEEESDEEQGTEEEDVKDDDEKDDEKASSEEEDEGDKDEEQSKGVKDEDVKGIRIPKFRFDAVAARAKAAEERAAELEAKLKELEGKSQPATETKPEEGENRDDLDAKLAEIDVKIAEAMKEGDADAIKELMAESRKLERDFYLKKMEEEATTKATQTAEQLQEAARLDLILTQLEEQFPIFDENSDQFDQDANDKVLEVQRAYIAAGRSPSDALVEAVNLVLPTLGYSEVSDPTDRPKDGKEAPKRSEKDVKRNTEAAKKQPPDLENIGDDSDKAGAKDTLPDPLQLTEEEYDALPEETKRAMRGDFV